MTRNEGALDRVVRIVLGAVLLSLTVIGPKTPIGLAGILLVATGLVGFCPLYRLLGIRTTPRSSGGATAT